VPLFADYEPLRHGAPPPDDLATRAATADDVPALAALRATRDEVSVEMAAAAFDRQLLRAREGDALVAVATIGDVAVGYGVVERLSIPGLPPGWYLGGVVVAPEHRRRGIGLRLTQERLAWIADRASQAYFFVNERNRPSIDLHARLGFRELIRDIRVPGLSFTNGVGLLFGVDLANRGAHLGER
jgi:ribosomal protein S18 acetylase RimI-like enzyme